MVVRYAGGRCHEQEAMLIIGSNQITQTTAHTHTRHRERSGVSQDFSRDKTHQRVRPRRHGGRLQKVHVSSSLREQKEERTESDHFCFVKQGGNAEDIDTSAHLRVIQAGESNDAPVSAQNRRLSFQ